MHSPPILTPPSHSLHHTLSSSLDVPTGPTKMLGSRPRRAKADEEAEPFLPDAPDSHAGTSSSSTHRAATSILPRRCCRAWGVLPRRRQLPRCLLFSLGWVSCALLFVSLVAGVLFPSYANPPAHYHELRSLVETSKQPGRANPNNEKIFIAASIYDAGGKLLSGTWGNAVLSLVDLLGPDNVHVSLYENDPDQAARQAAEEFRNKLACKHLLYSSLIGLSRLSTRRFMC